MASATPDISQDASSLRAAALLTLRAKAKPRPQASAEADRSTSDHLQDDASSVASTRRAPPSPELNYGSDDGLADAEGSTEEEEEEEGEKEEGEISEDEAAAAAKSTHTMMDIDNEPLPGLTSSSNRTQASENGGVPESKGHRQSPLAALSPTPKSNRGVPLSTNTPVLIPKQPSPTVPPKPSSPVPSPIAKPAFPPPPGLGSWSGSRFSERSPAINAPTGPRASLASTKLAGPLAPVASDSSLSRVAPSPLSQTGDNRRGAASMSSTERVGPKPSDSPSAATPVPPRKPPSELSRPFTPFIDNAHARPSLNMTAQEFTEAKTIILDLLGWGVPSEYFINCGFTREAIYYAFSEMNLKLPSNLNTEGIVPYGPPPGYVPVPSPPVPDPRPTREQKSATPVDSQLSEPPSKLAAASANNTILRDRRASLAVQPTPGPVKLGVTSNAPPHPLPPKPKSVTSPPSSPPTSGNLKSQALPQQSVSQMGSGSSHNGHGHTASNGFLQNQSSSSKLGAIPGLQAQFPPTAQSTLPVKPASSFTSDTPTHGYSGNLDEIETLRRQELQARKAVLASRKPKSFASKPLGSTPGPSSLTVQIPSSSPPLPSQRSPPPSESSNLLEKVPIPPETVDDFLKSITSGASTSSNGDTSHHPPLTHSPDSMDMDIDTNTPDGPPSGESRAPYPSAHASLPFPSSSTESQPIPGQSTYPPRRSSTKRPVASDFVDYDAPPLTRDSPFATSAPHNGGSNGRSRITLTSTPSFANIAATRKVVIDFSDSEDDEVVDGVSGSGVSDQRPPSGPPAAPPVSASAGLVFVGVSSAPTPEPRSPAPPGGVGGITPAALLAKEQEIKRMKELIAERERNRLKKLANPPKSVTPPLLPRPSGTSSSKPSTPPGIPMTEFVVSGSVPPTAPPKEEDIVSAPPPGREGNGSSSAGDLMEEDAVMHDILAAEASIPDMSTISTPPSTDASTGEMQNTATGEQVLTAEAGQEQVIDPGIDLANEAQVQDLPFKVQYVPAWPPEGSELSTLLRPLKEATLLKLDPKRAICQFEIPGAGKCRDSTCPNVHLRAFEPNDDETARYLAKALPAPQPTVQEVKAALSRIRASSKQELDLDTRVSQTLLQLGVR